MPGPASSHALQPETRSLSSIFEGLKKIVVPFCWDSFGHTGLRVIFGVNRHLCPCLIASLTYLALATEIGNSSPTSYNLYLRQLSEPIAQNSGWFWWFPEEG